MFDKAVLIKYAIWLGVVVATVCGLGIALADTGVGGILALVATGTIVLLARWMWKNRRT